MAIEVTRARQLSPQAGSLSVVAGPPGLGKSWVAGTMAEFYGADNVLALITLPREIDSLQYQRHDIPSIVIDDPDWIPEKKSLKATGYDKLMEILRELRHDKVYKALILDNGTEAGELAWHSTLAPLGVSDPNQLGSGSNRFAPYTTFSEKMNALLRSLGTLTGKTGLVAQPKVICVPWHVQPAKDGMGDNESSDEKGQGVEYEGDYLPMIRGGFRRRLMAVVDNYVYADLQQIPGRNSLSQMENHYVLQVISDNEKHVKTVGAQPPEDKLVKKKYLDVHGRHDAWRLFMDTIDAGKAAPTPGPGAKK
jgi:hypothetical protein